MVKDQLCKLLKTGIIAGTLMCMPTSAFAASNSIQITVDGKSSALNPVLHNDHLYIQVRELQDMFNADIQYNAKTREVTIKRGDVTLNIDLQAQTTQENGQSVDIPAPYLDAATNKTMVPLRAIAELFGEEVTWDSENRILAIQPTKQKVDQWQQIRSILENEQKAEQAKSGVHMAMDMSMKLDVSGVVPSQNEPMPFAGASQYNLTGSFTGDVTKNPLAIHFNGVMNLPVSIFGEPLKVDAYLKDGTAYIYNPVQKEWGKFTVMNQSQWNEITQLLINGDKTQEQQAEMNVLLPFMKLTDDTANNSYVITTYFNQTLLNKLNSLSPMASLGVPSPGTGESNAATANMPEINVFEVQTVIDKSTNLEKAVNFKMNVNGSAEENFNMDIVANAQADFDHVNTVTIPDDVLKQAIDMQNAGMAGSPAPTSPTPAQK